ncbi:MAG: riboflavin biosynthesis protein RibF [Phycisphaerae bacterium]
MIRGLEAIEAPLPSSVLTVGNFDGVHRGHQGIIARSKALAEQTAVPLAVLTFEPHPMAIVAPQKAPPRLMPLDEKLAHFSRAGVDLAVVADATPALLSLEPEAFVARIAQRFCPRFMVEGRSFGFGLGRKGSTQTLQELGPRYGFEVQVVDPVTVDLTDQRAAVVSSSLIRQLLAAARVHDAHLAAGHRYALFGDVVAGHHRGTDLGFPTANLAVQDQLVPPDGVYAGFARPTDASSSKDLPWLAAISIGSTPTFDSPGGAPARQIEAHLIDTHQDLHGRRLQLEFGHWIRAQRRFESPQALGDQIARDVEFVRTRADGQPEPQFRTRASSS